MLIGSLLHSFSKNPIFSKVDARERGRAYGKECELLLDWNDISLTTIQACVLLGAIAITDGKAASENIHYAVACRMAQLLDLPRRRSESSVEQEVNIRGIYIFLLSIPHRLIGFSMVDSMHDRCLVFFGSSTSKTSHSPG